MKNVTLYTDGACLGNPGPGGWCAILIYNKTEKVLSGDAKETTNNIMEITAVLNGLNALKETCNVQVFSDSAYVVNAFNQGWIYNWKKNGWRKSDNAEIKNKELFISLYDAVSKHNVVFNWVKGHAENEYNNKCDEIASSSAKKLKFVE